MTSPSPSSLLVPCVICDAPTKEFNYGAYTCNACKLFFQRRVKGRAKLPAKCSHPDTSNFRECKSCRLQRCYDMGMRIDPSPKTNNLATDELTNLLNNLKVMDEKRTEYLNHGHVENVDFGVEQLIANPLRIHERPAGTVMKFSSWVPFVRIVTIDHLKKIGVTSELDVKDQEVLIKDFMVKGSFFNHARISYSRKKGNLEFIDGTDCCPKEVRTNTSLDNKIRYRLVGRLAELRITDEEYLLLSLLFYCNPGISGLSAHGIKTICFYQEKYALLLFQLCQVTCQKNGPNRFSDLLSLCHVVNRTLEDIKQQFLCFAMKNPLLKFPKIVTEGNS